VCSGRGVTGSEKEQPVVISSIQLCISLRSPLSNDMAQRTGVIDAKLKHKPDGDCHLYHMCNKQNLVITIGDSWSYGDCLGDLGSHAYRRSVEWSQHRSLYRDARLTHCWGRHLADALSADWFEASTRGSCNDTILVESEWWCCPDADSFLSQYDHVYICVVLTEAGRAGKYHTLTPDPVAILHTEEADIYQRLQQLVKMRPNIHFWFGRNMTRSYDRDHVTGVPWIDVVAGESVAEQGWLSGVATYKLDNMYLQPNVPNELQQSWKQHFIAHTERVASVWDHLHQHELHYAGHTCHPKPQAHKMYADYVLANAGW